MKKDYLPISVGLFFLVRVGSERMGQISLDLPTIISQVPIDTGLACIAARSHALNQIKLKQRLPCLRHEATWPTHRLA